jgi:hypothetical protein
VTVVIITRDLITGTRMEAMVAAAGGRAVVVPDPENLPDQNNRLILVDWDARQPGWAEALRTRAGSDGASGSSRVILFGPHRDLDAHGEARAAGFGPMWARSRIFNELPSLVRALLSESSSD